MKLYDLLCDGKSQTGAAVLCAPGVIQPAEFLKDRLQSVGREDRKDISFTVARSDLQEAMTLLNENREAVTAQNITCEDGVAKVSIIGAGMLSNPGVAAKMFESLYSANINIKMIATSEIRITVLIDEADANRAVRTVHDAFDLAD